MCRSERARRCPGGCSQPERTLPGRGRREDPEGGRQGGAPGGPGEESLGEAGVDGGLGPGGTQEGVSGGGTWDLMGQRCEGTLVGRPVYMLLA